MLATTTLVASLLIPQAQAAQSHDVGNFDGSYAIECTEVAINLHLGVAAWVGGASGSWATGATVELSCDEVSQYDETWYEAYDASYADCPEWLLGAEGCDEYASGIADAFADINNGFIGIIPHQVDVAVNSASWFNRWLGIYPASTYNQADAGDWSGSMILDNRDRHAGNFLSGAIGAVGPWSGVACIDVGVALVTGNIDPDADYDVEAEFGLDNELICGLGNGSALVLASVGLTFAGAVEGEKL